MEVDYDIRLELYSIEYVLTHGYYKEPEYKGLIEELKDLKYRVERENEINKLL